MKKMKKRFLSSLLSLAMVLGMLSSLGVPTYAENGDDLPAGSGERDSTQGLAAGEAEDHGTTALPTSPYR